MKQRFWQRLYNQIIIHWKSIVRILLGITMVLVICLSWDWYRFRSVFLTPSSSPLRKSLLLPREPRSSSPLLSLRENTTVRVTVLQFVSTNWNIEHRTGVKDNCDRRVECEWISGDDFKMLRKGTAHHAKLPNEHKVSVGLYNIHTLNSERTTLKPQLCEFETNITMYETEESYVRWGSTFNESNKYFDAVSSTHPASDVQRVYDTFTKPYWMNRLRLTPFEKLIKAGVYIASDCHTHDLANIPRDEMVKRIRSLGLRVDGVGKCLRSASLPRKIARLDKNPEKRYKLDVKRDIINKYAFYMAFENTREDGYVTEKGTDALLAGSVPVYAGDSKHLKSLLPHPKAAIFVDDFQNADQLVTYLQYLLKNETAYEEHRAWQRDFDYDQYIAGKPLLEKSWECSICEWAAEQYQLAVQRSITAPLLSKVSNRKCKKDKPRGLWSRLFSSHSS